MEVTDVLRDRMHEPAGLQRMVAVSIAAHIVFGATLVLMPARFFGGAANVQRVVMTISLGGNTGPDSGGMTQSGGRAVQVQTPPENPARREAVRPPAAKALEMVLPRRDVKVTKSPTPAPKITQAP